MLSSYYYFKYHKQRPGHSIKYDPSQPGANLNQAFFEVLFSM